MLQKSVCQWQPELEMGVFVLPIKSYPGLTVGNSGEGMNLHLHVVGLQIQNRGVQVFHGRVIPSYRKEGWGIEDIGIVKGLPLPSRTIHA